MIQPLKVSNSDNATMWTNLMVIILSEINQTKKGQTFCDSTSMRYPNKSNAISVNSKGLLKEFIDQLMFEVNDRLRSIFCQSNIIYSNIFVERLKWIKN